MNKLFYIYILLTVFSSCSSSEYFGSSKFQTEHKNLLKATPKDAGKIVTSPQLYFSESSTGGTVQNKLTGAYVTASKLITDNFALSTGLGYQLGQSEINSETTTINRLNTQAFSSNLQASLVSGGSSGVWYPLNVSVNYASDAGEYKDFRKSLPDTSVIPTFVDTEEILSFSVTSERVFYIQNDKYIGVYIGIAFPDKSHEQNLEIEYQPGFLLGSTVQIHSVLLGMDLNIGRFSGYNMNAAYVFR